MSFCSILRRSVALVIAAALPAAPVFAQGQGAVAGAVRDAVSREPVTSATIRAEGSTRVAISDRDGRFRLEGIREGPVILITHRLGYRELRQSVDVKAGATVDTELLVTESPALVTALTVTASRTREEQSRDLPVSIGVVGTEELTHMRPSHVAQPLNRIAGVHMTEFEGGGSYSSIRQPMCCRSTLLFMEDGIPFTSPAYYSPNYVGLVNFAQASQVEVLKGPGTAVYGSDAVTGVVNFITAMAPLAPTASLAIEGGAAGYRRAIASAGGTFGRNNLSFTANAAAADGRRQNPYRTLGTALRWHTVLADGSSLRTLVSFNSRDGTGADDQTLEQFKARSRFNPYPIAFDDWRTLRFSTSYRREQGKTSWSITPFARYEDTDRVPGWQLAYDPVVWQVTSRSAGVLTQVRREVGGRMNARFTGGIDVDVTPGRRREPVITPIRSNDIWVDYRLDAVAPHYDYRMLYRGASAYSQFEFNPLERLRITAGARFDASHYRYDNLMSTEQTGLFRRPADTSLSYRGLTPKLGAVYSIGEDTRMFASFRRGFRVPIEQQLFKQGASANTLGLDPVQVTSWEVGVKSRIADRVSYELSGYSMHLDDDILSVRDPQGIATLTNNGRTVHRGVELSASATFTRTLRMNVAVTQALHRFDRWAPSATLDYSGNEMDAAPRSLRNAVLAWQPRWLGGGQVELEYNGTGGYYVDGANTQRQAGYDILNLRAGWMLRKRWEVYGRLMNVTDQLYAAETFPGFGAVPRVMNPGEYRALYMGVRAQF